MASYADIVKGSRHVVVKAPQLGNASGMVKTPGLVNSPKPWNAFDVARASDPRDALRVVEAPGIVRDPGRVNAFGIVNGMCVCSKVDLLWPSQN